MTAHAHARGWPIAFIDGRWVHADTGEPATRERPCVRCRRMPTPAGHDACLGHLAGVRSACCGHGVAAPYVVRA